ncbi:hypothetical protein X801_10581 [Opisthorchis viverrini]|uniref:Uncharacterized protein n=1 Tax=Opisthorchis viverrini TaxID=6198 RepID=A0A1S8WGV3_OPIVI|nr:hypothetical protein X801_10581 [Opisthorchis viverrini]
MPNDWSKISSIYSSTFVADSNLFEDPRLWSNSRILNRFTDLTILPFMVVDMLGRKLRKKRSYLFQPTISDYHLGVMKMTGDVEALNIRLNYLTRYIQHQRTEIKELEKRVHALEQQQKQARQSNSESRSAFLDSSVEYSSVSSQRHRRRSPKKPVVRQKPVRSRTSPCVTLFLQY